MRKNIFLALAASSLLFCACGGDSNTVGGEPQSNAVQQITLQVASSGDGLTTRAGRELESSEAAQDIQHVKVIVCDASNTVKFTTTIDDWDNNGSTAYGSTTSSAHGRQATLTIPESEHLTQGTYTIYAIGYSDNSDYDLTAITSAAKNGTFNENTAISLQTGKTDAEEIFAGSNASYKIEEGKIANGTVILNRQVAGSYGYVKDIPCVDGATELQLVASTGNSQLILGNFANAELYDNGGNNGSSVKYVVNGGTAATSEKVIYTIDLTQWFTDVTKDENGDGLIDADNNWKGNATKYANGSAFAGKFIIPFSKIDNSQTFKLRLVKPGSTTAEREWNVNLPTSDGQISAHSFTAWNSTDSRFVTTTAVQDTKNVYSVVRNHLYGIGTRLKATPDTPDVPGTDEPQSLKKAQNITLRVNDNWEVIHKMELE